MIKNDTLMKYFKMNLKSFIILVYLKILRLYSLNSLKLEFFNKMWVISVGSTLFSITLSSLVGDILTKNIIKIYEKNINNKKDNSTSIEILSMSLSIFYVLFFKFIYMFFFVNKNIINEKYIQVTIISILSITFYTIVIKPLFADTNISKFLNFIIRDTILLLSSDFIEDANINKNWFDIEISTVGTFFRIILNSLIKI